MVDYTKSICRLIDSSLAQILAFDTSGIELYVTENDPKTLNTLIKTLRSYYKDNSNISPYKMVYSLMPSQTASCPDVKHLYIKGHFCYAGYLPGNSAFDTVEIYGGSQGTVPFLQSIDSL